MDSTSIPLRLAKSLPDTPDWIDIRGMLLSGRATVPGGDSVDGGFVVRALSGALAVVGVVGRPAHEHIAHAVEGVTDMTPVIAQHDNAEHVRQALSASPASSSGHAWTPECAILHRLTTPPDANAAPDEVVVRLLGADDRLDHLPPGLRYELTHARETAPIAAALVGGVPASFCYPCWLTETLWDVSIDTLEQYRRRGLAERVVDLMTARMREEGREPVWCAMESNAASLALARKLGFTPVGEIVVFSRGPWAYLTRGFGEAP